MSKTTASHSGFARCFYAFQFFYGGWFLFHGLNWWLRYFPEKSFGPDAHGLIPELIRSGLFDIVKLLEVVIGIALLADLYVPLAIVAAFPITFVIAWLNASKGNPFGLSVAAIIVALNALMAVGHLDRYWSMLVMRAGPPNADGLRPSARPFVGARLAVTAHALAIVLGIAVPAALTYASIHFAKPVPGAPSH